MRFTKMQGLGNDFVLLEQHDDVPPELVRKLCDRRFGVGADGVLTASADDGEIIMGYWNADGSPAEMCGNGLRCVARYAFDRGWVTARMFEVRTPSGPRRVTVHDDGTVTAAIGSPILAEAISLEGCHGVPVDVGNPHVVIAVDDLSGEDVATLGPRLQTATGANVELMRVGSDALEVRTWERGVGETLACGSGAVAAAAVAHAHHGGAGRIRVRLRGGELLVDVGTDPATITGSADYVFEGELGAH